MSIVVMNAHYGESTFAEQCKNSVKAYAELHGYGFYHEPASAFPGDPSKPHHFHFWRSYVIQNAARAFPDARWFLWLDSDIYVNVRTKHIKLEDLIELDPFMLYYTTHERPWGIDCINTGFKLVNRDALGYEAEIWASRDMHPFNTFTFEQFTLWRKIFPRIISRFTILGNKQLNCIIKAYRDKPDILANGLFMHMCNMSLSERNAWCAEAVKKGEVFL